MKSECDKWLNTLSDEAIDDYSQSSLANEAWKRGAAYAAQSILNHLEYIETAKLAASGNPKEATDIGAARVCADQFIKD